MNERAELTVAILAAFLVLFSALLPPPVSAIVALAILAALVLYRPRHADPGGD
jgi:hypothetical protein